MTTQLHDTIGTPERPLLKWGRVEERVLHHLCPLFLQLPGSSAVTVYDKKQAEHLLWYLVPAFASKVNEPFVVLGVFWFDPHLCLVIHSTLPSSCLFSLCLFIKCHIHSLCSSWGYFLKKKMKPAVLSTYLVLKTLLWTRTQQVSMSFLNLSPHKVML